MKYIFLLIPILFACCPKSKLYPTESYTLDNGLQVILAKTEGAEILSQVIVYKAGRMDEVEGKSGIAHFVEHLMFRGDNKDYSSVIEKIGGKTNAYTSQDITTYYSMVNSKDMELVIELEAKRMGNLSFSDEEYLTEKQVIEQERVMRYGDSPRASFFDKLNAARWENHPYSIPVIGIQDEFLKTTPQDIKDFYNKFYAPNNSVLVLSGNFDVKKAKGLIEKNYGKYQSKPINHSVNILPEFAQSELSQKDNKVGENLLTVSYLVDALGQKNNLDTFALMVAAEVLGGQEYNSVLYKKLVKEQGLATSVSASINGFKRDAGIFSISVSFSDTNNMEKIKEIIFSELENIEKNGIGTEKLKTVKDVFLASFVYQKENLFSTADLLGSATTIGSDLNTLELYLNKLDDKDIKKSVAHLLNEDNRFIGYLYGDNENE